MENLDRMRRGISAAGGQKEYTSRISQTLESNSSGSHYSRKASVDDIQLAGVNYWGKSVRVWIDCIPGKLIYLLAAEHRIQTQLPGYRTSG